MVKRLPFLMTSPVSSSTSDLVDLKATSPYCLQRKQTPKYVAIILDLSNNQCCWRTLTQFCISILNLTQMCQNQFDVNVIN